jgi:hypothetical protein
VVLCAVVVLCGLSPDLCRESVYAVYSGEVKIGRLVLGLAREGDAYTLTTDFAAVLAVGGERRALEFREQKFFDARAPHRLLRMTHASNLEGAPVHWSGAAVGGRFLVTKGGATTAAALPDVTLPEALGRALFVRTQPAAGARSDDGRARVVAHARELVEGRLVDAFVLEEDGEKSTYLADGQLFEGSFAGLRVRREAVGRVPEIALATRVAATSAAAPAHGLAHAAYLFPDLRLPATARQKLAGRVGDQVLLEVAAEALPAVTAAPAAADLPAEAPEVAALASALAGDLPLGALLEAFAAWIAAHVASRELDGTLPASGVLAARAGDCSERAELFAALCRARGIPARRVTGLLWRGDGLYGHAWCEVLLDAWREVDPATGGPVDARAILLWREDARLELLALLNRTVRVVRTTPRAP